MPICPFCNQPMERVTPDEQEAFADLFRCGACQVEQAGIGIPVKGFWRGIMIQVMKSERWIGWCSIGVTDSGSVLAVVF